MQENYGPVTTTTTPGRQTQNNNNNNNNYYYYYYYNYCRLDYKRLNENCQEKGKLVCQNSLKLVIYPQQKRAKRTMLLTWITP